MTIHGDVCAILIAANVAGGDGHVFPESLPEGANADEYVIVTRPSYTPTNALTGYAGITESIVILESWSRNGKAAAQAVAAAANAAMDADTTLPIKSRQQVSGEQFEPGVMENMEPSQYSIWHP